MPELHALALHLSFVMGVVVPAQQGPGGRESVAVARNAVIFVGDGMGVSTVSATRIFSVGVGGKLVLDFFPYTAISRTYSADAIVADSAATMTAMMTGRVTNSGVLGLDKTTEPKDFNKDGDGAVLSTLLEKAKAAGKSVGIVTTARVTHATPAACYAHINDRGNEVVIALHALPGSSFYNQALGAGIDLLAGGGRKMFVPLGVVDEEGDLGVRSDGRDLRAEFQQLGYTYVWKLTQWRNLNANNLPVLALFESSHMEYEHDRPGDVGGEPSLSEMALKAIQLLNKNPNGFLLIVESGRIDHAHHANNAWRALVDAEQLDMAIGAVAYAVNLNETLIVATADHSHVLQLGGSGLRPPSELPYATTTSPSRWQQSSHGGVLNTVFKLNRTTGVVYEATDLNGVPYTVLSYAGGPGARSGARVDPRIDPFAGWAGASPGGPLAPQYRQEALIPLASASHAGEDVMMYAVGSGSWRLHGTVKNTALFFLVRGALGI